jgi:ABC-2 type transport system permease protein
MKGAASLHGPATVLWLFWHEMRLLMRMGGKHWEWSVAICIVLWLLMHGLALLSSPVITAITYPDAMIEKGAGMAVLGALLFLLPIAWQLVIRQVYERSDYDLLFSSPLPGRIVLPAKLAAIAVSISMSLLLITSAYFNVFALKAGAVWLYGYVSLFALIIIAVLLAYHMQAGLIRLLGAVRAKNWGQILSAVASVGIIIVLYLPYFKGEDAQFSFSFDKDESDSSGPVMRLIGQFALGHGWPAFLGMAALLGAVWHLYAACGPGFARSVLEASGSGAVRKRRRGDHAEGAPLFGRIRAPMQAMAMKDWKLIARDPNVIMQISLFAMIALPFIIPGVQRSMEVADGVFIKMAWFSIPPSIGLITSAIVWLSMAGEEAPHLLLSAPLTQRQISQAKILSYCAPGLLFLTPASLYIALIAPTAGLALFLSGCLAIIVFAHLAMGAKPPAQGRAHFNQRYNESPLRLLLEMLVSGFIYALTWLCFWGAVQAPWLVLSIAAGLNAIALHALLRRPAITT